MLQRRKRAERALTSVVATCYLLGVSTRRMEKLVESLGIPSLSKSKVAVMADDLDAKVEAFRSRPWMPARAIRRRRRPWCSRSGRTGGVVNMHALVAAVVNAEGYREILDIVGTGHSRGALSSDHGRSLEGSRRVHWGYDTPVRSESGPYTIFMDTTCFSRLR
ncbi:transposase [Rhodococcus koreensis]|uniref:transposase n=1 Tax=Rhodococcus koreensis TaxID=99653 RepID=UPI00366C6C37